MKRTETVKCELRTVKREGKRGRVLIDFETEKKRGQKTVGQKLTVIEWATDEQ